MRETKYKVWDKDEQKMLKVYQIQFQQNGVAVYVRPRNSNDFVRIRNPILIQYTNIKDRSGKKVYEKDIVEFDYAGVERRKAYVEWNGYYYGLEAFAGDDTSYTPLFTQYAKALEVIGNIYENPELLTK